MKAKIWFLIIFISFAEKSQAQSCFNVSAGNDTTISCLTTCLDLKTKIPDVRTSETYQVISIPYTPYLYTTPGGTTDPLVDADDHFSDSFFLPFPFCFYGNIYNKICVGSNGVITFDVLLNAKTIECFNLNASNTLPYAGGSPNGFLFYAPRASIFLAYYDLNPATSPPGNKIEWRVEGTAPCRRFVVSYYRIGHFSNSSSTCPNSNPANLCTMQAVLYEGSGIIDVFYENKPACMNSQGGLSIAGVQNWVQNQSVSPPNTNCTVWSAINKGYRYVPSGSGSLLNRVELYKNGTLISTGTTTILGNGELEALFPNICQSEDSMSYMVRAFYRQCDNPAIETEGSDTIIVYKGVGSVVTEIVDVPCNGDLGKITVLSPYSPPNIEYSINGGTTWQTLNVFNVPAGTYTVLAREIGTLCTSNKTVTINQPAPFVASSTATSIATCGNNAGAINITATGGTPPFQYSIDNGISWQSSNVFSNLPSGNYSIRVKDALNCLVLLSGIVPLNDTMRLELGPDSTICFGNSLILMPQTNVLTDTFKWIPIPASGSNLSSDTAKNPIAKPSDTTRYILIAKWGICQRKDTVTINVLHKPIAFAGKDTAICYKTIAFLKGTATNLSGTVNYLWSPSANVVPPNAANAVASPDSTQVYFLTLTDNYGCSFLVTDSILVIMQPRIFAFAGNDTNAITGKPHQLLGSGGTNYLWSPAGRLNNPFISNPLATIFSDTYFTLLVSDSIGCIDTDDVFIKVYDGPNYYVPNAFSPNGDGLNDIFRPIPVGIRNTQYFRVFNRYGELIFQTNEWLKGWDGTYKGKKALFGTYMWEIKGTDKNGREIVMKGTVILVR